MADIIAAIATGKQPCAIGILRLSGEGCAEVVAKVFRLQSGKDFTQAPNRKLCMGTLFDRQGRVIDQALAVYTRAPHTYTGEDTVELQCHGSPAVLAAGLDALFAVGARQAGPGEFTKRAFLNGQMDLTMAEAVIDLIDAETADAAANAAMQVGGAMYLRVNPLYEQMMDICSHFHAVLDYPDEEIPDFQMGEFTATLQNIAAKLDQMLRSFEHGKILRHGVQAVILGKPNVGKSSLLNALAGFERVIVTDIAGTTRDTVEQSVRLGKVLLRLVDTAGIHQTEDRVEALGVARSEEAAKQADLALFVCDGSQPLDDEDRYAMDAAMDAPRSIALINKSDLKQVVLPSDLPFDTVIEISAKENAGLDSLEDMVNLWFADQAPCDGSILTNTRQAGAVERAKKAVEAALDSMYLGMTPDAVLVDVEGAMEALGEITGRTVREDITNRIFERFCVGK